MKGFALKVQPSAIRRHLDLVSHLILLLYLIYRLRFVYFLRDFVVLYLLPSFSFWTVFIFFKHTKYIQ